MTTKIYIFCSFLYKENFVTGGHGTLIRQLSSKLLEKGFEVEVVCLYGQTNSDDIFKVTILQNWVHNPSSQIYMKILFWLKAIISILKFVLFKIPYKQKKRFISLTAGASFILPFLFRHVIIWENIAYFNKRPKIDKIRLWLFKIFAAIVVVPTEEEKKQLDLSQFSPKILFIKNWYTPNIKFKQKKVNNLKIKKFLLGGMLQKRKGFDLFVEAVNIANNKLPENVSFDIYGTGLEHLNISKLINHYGLDEKITLKGFFKDFDKLYHEYDAFILPSRLEGFPLVMINALACGLPVIAYDCPTGPRSIIVSGNGILVKNGDIKEMAEAIIKFTKININQATTFTCLEATRTEYSLDVIIDDWIVVLGQ